MTNRRITSAVVAVLLAISIPAGAAQAAEQAKVITVTMPASPAQPGAPEPAAEPKVTSAQAEAALRELFTLPEKSAKVDLQWNLSSHGAKPIWELQIMVRDGNGAMSSGIAAVDAVTGRILRYGAYGMLPGPVRTGPLGPVHSEEEARARAWALVQKVVPERAAQLKEAVPGTPGYYPWYYGYGGEGMGDAYAFNWIEHHDGVPFPNSTVNVVVKKETLEYASLSINLLDSIKFQPGPAKATLEDATRLWQAEVKPNLAYQPIYKSTPFGPSRPTGYRLVYSFENLGRPIDAMTGTWVKDPEPYPQPPMSETKPAEPEPVPAGSATPVLPDQLPLTDEAARKLASTVLELPQSAQLRTENYFFPDEKLLQFHVSDQSRFGNIQLDPATGLIRNAYRSEMMGPMSYPPKRADGSNVSPEQEERAKQAAFAVVQTYYSQIRDQVWLEAMPSYWGSSDEPVRRFRFVRRVNGLPLPNDTIMVTIDLSTMTWRDMNANWTTGLTFPNPAGAISPEKAKETVLADLKPMLAYRAIYPGMAEAEMRMGRFPQPTEAALTYIPAGQTYGQIDAITGQSLSYEGTTLLDIQNAYKLIKGHWAEGELQFVLSRGIVQPDQLNPDATLTRGQAVALLLQRNMKTYDSGPTPLEMPYVDLPETHPAFGAVRMAWRQGWLRPLGDETHFNPDAPLTRAVFAVWAARALGLGDLARSGLTVKSEYKDLENLGAEQRNAVSFLQALGILGQGDTFRGAEYLTQAEGAAITVRLYNYMVKQ